MAKHFYQTLYDCFGPEKDLCFLTAENIPRPHTKPQVCICLKLGKLIGLLSQMVLERNSPSRGAEERRQDQRKGLEPQAPHTGVGGWSWTRIW